MIRGFFKKIWNDPVWSSVLSGFFVLLLTPFCARLYSWIGGNDFRRTLENIVNYEVKLWIVAVLVLAYFIIRGFITKFGSFRYDDHSYKNDKAIYDTIIRELSFDGIISFLRTNNFAGFSFRLSSLEELDNFYNTYPNDPSFEFLNPRMEELKVNLIEDINEFENLIALNTFPCHQSERQTVPPEWEVSCPDHFFEVVDKIHNAARNICSDYDSIVRIGKRVIKL